MFKKILVLTKSGLKLKEDIVLKISNMAPGAHVESIDFENFKKIHLNNKDLVITIGGDGTFVKAGNLIEDAYLLGVNANPETSEGALTSLDIDHLNKLKSIFEGNFKTNIIQRARTKLNGKILDELAINEVYVGASSQFHSSRYKINYKGKEEEHRSSGVIVSTGTGSAAWLHSAGGKIFPGDEERLSFIIREPYYGKRIFRPTILQGDLLKDEKIIIKSERDFGGIVAINDSTYDFNNGDIVEIDLSNKPLKVIDIK